MSGDPLNQSVEITKMLHRRIGQVSLQIGDIDGDSDDSERHPSDSSQQGGETSLQLDIHKCLGILGRNTVQADLA